MMDANAIQKIVDLAPPTLSVVGGQTWASKSLAHIPNPSPEALTFHTLTSLVEYLKADVDKLWDLGKADVDKLWDLGDVPAVHVESHGLVSLVSRLAGVTYQRLRYVQVALELPQFRFGSFADQESFLIALQTQFVPTPETLELMLLVGRIKGRESSQSEDDGMVQNIVIEQGVQLVRRETIRNPVNLRPYRTFREVEQPESPFILRVRADAKNPATLALFEADGGTWQLTAIQTVAAWLRERIPPGVPILA